MSAPIGPVNEQYMTVLGSGNKFLYCTIFIVCYPWIYFAI